MMQTLLKESYLSWTACFPASRAPSIYIPVTRPYTQDICIVFGLCLLSFPAQFLWGSIKLTLLSSALMNTTYILIVAYRALCDTHLKLNSSGNL